MLKPETKARLDEYLAKVIGERRNLNVGFDDIINEFLDAADEKDSGSRRQ